MPHDLDRYLVAQEQEANGYRDAILELRSGCKTGHWMWWIFPQIEGLGDSDRARRYGIVSLDEARAYLADPTLGPRLLECARALLATEGLTVHDIFEHPDELKLCSSMTLYLSAAPDEPLFREVLDRFFDGKPDQRTTAKLQAQGPPVPEPPESR